MLLLQRCLADGDCKQCAQPCTPTSNSRERAQETIWRQLPPLAKALGKREFKRHLEPFVDPSVLVCHAPVVCGTFVPVL